MSEAFPNAGVTSPSAPKPPGSDVTGLTGGLPARNLARGGEVARGGMGAVLHAEDLNIGRSVAVKVLLPGRETSAENLSRFIEEAQVTGQLEHPGIVPIYDLGIDDHGQPFYTMKFVKGVTLKEVIAKLAAGDKAAVAKYTPGHLLTVFQKVCDAMTFAHSKGIVHRDLKPENLMLGNYGEVLVMDWGLAKRLDNDKRPPTDGPEGSSVLRPPSSPLVTQDGTIKGTPHYMAPEQAAGQVELIDARTDIYALGAILYTMLTLEPPVSGATVGAVLARVRHGAIVPPAQRKQVPAALSSVAMKALAKAQTDRYQSVPELQRDIEAYQAGFATSAEHAGAWRQISLFVCRHKAVSTAIAASVLVLTGVVSAFVIKVTAERNRVVSALADLKATAPAHYAEALSLIKDGKFEEALEKISYAAHLQPRSAQYHYLRGNVLESLLRIAEAREAYVQAVSLNRAHPLARANLELCQQILRDNVGRSELSATSLQSLYSLMRTQDRLAESLALTRRLSNRNQAFLDTWKAVLDRAGIPSGGLTVDPAGLLHLEVKSKPLTNLSPLKEVPLTSLYLFNVNVADLKPLQGMQLRSLRLDNVRVKDLTPLKGMPLEVLRLSYGSVSDLSPLAAMKLKDLALHGLTQVKDLSPLRGMPLTKLDIWKTQVTDLRPLAGMPLQDLHLNDTLVTDLAPLEGMPLKSLDLTRAPVTDLTLLKRLPLTNLALTGSAASDFSPLKGMALTSLDLGGTAIRDLTLLVGMPLKRLSLAECRNVQDLTPLAKCTQLEELAIPEGARNMEALRQLPRLRGLSYRWAWTKGEAATRARDFWKDYDATPTPPP